MFLLKKYTACLLLLSIISIATTACEEDISVPKPRAYPRVDYPAKVYKPFDAAYCNFTFDQPAYATIERDTTFFGGKVRNDCWFNLDIAALNAKVYFTYNQIGSRADFDRFVQDAYEMTNKHNVKASYIEEIPIERKADQVYGIVFNVEGPVASAYQFFLTDSTHNFVRGALYFNTQARPDSLAPVLNFMKADVNRMIQTLKWRS